VLPGDTATFTVVLTPGPGLVGNTVTLTCPAPGTTLPPYTICLINGMNPLIITVTSTGSITLTVILETNCPGLLAPRQPWPQPPVPLLPTPLGALGMIAWFLALAWRRIAPAGSRVFGIRNQSPWVRRLVPACAGLLLVLLVMTWTACVSNLPPILPNQPITPAGVYPLTISASVPGIQPVTVKFTVHVI